MSNNTHSNYWRSAIKPKKEPSTNNSTGPLTTLDNNGSWKKYDPVTGERIRPQKGVSIFSKIAEKVTGLFKKPSIESKPEINGNGSNSNASSQTAGGKRHTRKNKKNKSRRRK